jgi:hypothetical protein
MSCDILMRFSCRSWLWSRWPRRDRQLGAKNLAEERRFALYVPQFQVGRALQRQSQDDFVAAHHSAQLANGLRVTPIESVGHPQQRCQLAHVASLAGKKSRHRWVVQVGRAPPVKAGDARDDVALAVG